jgi:hypothetical protein
MRCAAVVVAALAAILPTEPTWAYRPFDGTDSSVADLGALEVELGPAGYLRQGATHTLIAPATRLNYGFAQDWETVLESDWSHGLSAGSGGSSLVNMLSAKHVLRDGFLQDKAGPSVASELAVLLPGTAAGENGIGGSLSGIVSEQWGWLRVHLNVVATVTRQQHGDLFIGTIFEGPQDWAVRPVAEVFHEREYGGAATTSGLVGAIWAVKDSLAVDAALRHAWSEGHTADEVRLGVTFSFGLR